MNIIRNNVATVAAALVALALLNTQTMAAKLSGENPSA